MADKVTSLASEDLETFHPDYLDRVAEWEQIDDVCSGSRRVKERATLYLPKLSGQSDDEYKSFKGRAKFFAATGRTREALAGMLLRKKPQIEQGTIPDEVIADVTLNNLDLEDYARQVAEAGVSKGRAGTFIDYSETEAQPYLSFYKAEDVINWATSRIGGRAVLTMLVLREWEDLREEFSVTRRKRIRRYWLDTKNLENADETDDVVIPAVLCETWVEDTSNGGKSFTLETAEVELKRLGTNLDMIPFVFHNSNTLGSEVGSAPLADVAELNLSHYTTSADLEQGRHIVGLPTPVITGVDDTVKDLRLGSENCFMIENEAAKAYFLEFTGSGLSELRLALEETAGQMAQLGARLLFDQKKEAEAFETHELRATSETAALSQIAGTLSVSMTEVLQWVEWWNTNLAKPSDSSALFVFNQDFVASSIQPQLLATLLQVYVSGSMSFESFFHSLKKGELYPDDWDLERELAAITAAQNLPGPSRTLPPEPEDDDDDDEEEESEN